MSSHPHSDELEVMGNEGREGKSKKEKADDSPACSLIRVVAQLPDVKVRMAAAAVRRLMHACPKGRIGRT